MRAEQLIRSRAVFVLFGIASAVLLSSCGETEREGNVMATDSPDLGSFEKDGKTFDRYNVNDTVFEIPRAYAVMPPTRTDLVVTAYWPGLEAGDSEFGSVLTDSVRLMFETSRGVSQEEYDRHFLQVVERGSLQGPTWNESLQLFVYKDEWNAPVLLVSERFTESDPSRHVISCLGGADWATRDIECRVSMNLNTKNDLQYRFFADLLPSWRALDADVRSFAKSLMNQT